MGRRCAQLLIIAGLAVGAFASVSGSAVASSEGDPPGRLSPEASAGIWGDRVVAVADREGQLWRVTASGAVTAPDGKFFGDMSQGAINRPIVGMAVTATGNGYWLLGDDGGVFSFGDAEFFGSTGGIGLNQPVRGLAPDPDGDGYWFVASDGGIFAFGGAGFKGSMGGTPLNQQIVGMTETASGNGYWMVAADGGIFAFGDAGFFGSLGGNDIGTTVIGMAVTPSGNGYWIFDALGGVHEFGDAANVGDAAGLLNGAVVGAVPVVVNGSATGFWMVTENGTVYSVTSNGVDIPFSGDAPPPEGSYSWLISASNPDGSPIRWDGCTPIPYWTDLSLAPPSAAGILDDVIARIEAVSGYDLVFQGTTTQLAGEFMDTADYGLLMRFSTTSQEPGLASGAIGLGGLSAGAIWNDGWYYFGTKGTIQLRADFSFTEGWGRANSMHEVFAHEIGHALNLGHVSLTDEVMYGAAIGVGDLGEGTSYALNYASAAPCRPSNMVAASMADDAPNDIRVSVAVGERAAREERLCLPPTAGSDEVAAGGTPHGGGDEGDCNCSACTTTGRHAHSNETTTFVMEVD